MVLYLGNFLSPKNILPHCILIRNFNKYGKPPGMAKNLQQRLNEMNYKDPELSYQVNIGFSFKKPKRTDKTRLFLDNIKSQNKTQMEKLARLNQLRIPLEKVNESWLSNEGPEQLKNIAEHYGVFQDLFGDAFFYPVVNLNINFDNNSPVFRGNIIKPIDVQKPPEVHFQSSTESLWTLILTNPDGHFTDQNAEYIHWFIGNIPGSDLSKGQVVWPYLQAFPPKGTGYHRMIFILYKQEKIMDYSNLIKSSPCTQLSERTFKTEDFYRERQEHLTPAGLAFFQTTYDYSLRDFFHNTLNMKEPIFEYNFPKAYVKPQVWFPLKEAFNTYLDRYREDKDIAKEFITRKLKNYNPFEKPEEPFPYPNALPDDNKKPSWLRKEIEKSRLNIGRINEY